MITLYAVRHGETDYNNENRVQGTKDSQLTDFGTRQASALAQHCKSLNINEIYCSPLQRAYKTAEAVANASGIEDITTIKEFQELNCGIFEDMLIDDIKKNCWDKWQNFLSNPAVTPENGESMNQLALRVSNALDMILGNAGENDNILIVSHAGVVRMTLAHLMNIPVGSAVNFGLSNASIAKFIKKYQHWTCLSWNDTDHLGDIEGEVKFVL